MRVGWSLMALSVLMVLAPGCGSGSEGGCESDIDCKGDRICVDGKCVSPPDASDTDGGAAGDGTAGNGETAGIDGGGGEQGGSGGVGGEGGGGTGGAGTGGADAGGNDGGGGDNIDGGEMDGGDMDGGDMDSGGTDGGDDDDASVPSDGGDEPDSGETPPGSGETCSEAIDVSGESFPFQVMGSFDVDPAYGGSCAGTPYNAIWYTYTPSQSGSYGITAVDKAGGMIWSDLEVYQTASCSPPGPSLACDLSGGDTVQLTVDMTSGEQYLLVFSTGSESMSMQDPEIDIELIDTGPGHTCAQAIDLTGETFPYQVIGTFSHGPLEDVSCSAGRGDVVWFRYTAAADGWYDIEGTNNSPGTTTPVLVVYETAACEPHGAEQICELGSSDVASTTVLLSQGEEYLILFLTNHPLQPVVDPEITIAPAILEPGYICESAIDVSSESFPFQVMGSFDIDPTYSGSCFGDPYNAIWYTYTPSESGTHGVTAVDNAGGMVFADLEVYQTASCSPPGPSLACDVAGGSAVQLTVDMTSGEEYLVVFATGSESMLMQNPEIDIDLVSIGPGHTCAQAIDLTGETFPYQVLDTFSHGPLQDVSCSAAGGDVVWFRYTPAADGWYDIEGTNNSLGTTTPMLAVYETAVCDPHGDEQICETGSSDVVSTTVYLSNGAEYLILFLTNHPLQPMVDPEITIAPAVLEPGSVCETAIDVSAESFPFQVMGSFDINPLHSGSCTGTLYNAIWYTYTPSESGTYGVTAVDNVGGMFWSDLEVYQTAACYPPGLSLTCDMSADNAPQLTMDMTSGQQYLLVFSTGSESMSMQNPELDIELISTGPGHTCAQAIDLTGETFPYQVLDTFSHGPLQDVSCSPTRGDVVWFRYTPAVDGSYDIEGTNNSLGTTAPIVAVYETAACDPHGDEQVCETGSSDVVSTSVQLSQGVEYLILFLTSDALQPMVDPEIAISL